MKTSRWLIIGTDLRMKACKEFMEKSGYTCVHIQTDDMCSLLKETLEKFQPTQIVFPVLQMSQSIPVRYLKGKPTLYVGTASEKWLKPYVDQDFPIFFYLQEETFIWANASITAEAFLIEYYKKTKQVIQGKHFYVAGYGRVGKHVAKLLDGMGGQVTVLARAKEQLAEAESLGYNSQSIDDPPPFNNRYIVNTIPAKWLHIKGEKPLFVFDLASKPGCLIGPEKYEYYKILPGLPGKHFSIDAAFELSNALIRMSST